MKRYAITALIGTSILGIAGSATNLCGATAGIVFENDFEQVQRGHFPAGFLLLDGRFEVREEDGNRFLELPGAPLDTFGVMFGSNATHDVSVSARILGTARGRRFPTFAVSLNGIAGYKLQVTPAKRAVELFRGEDLVASVEYEWESGKWTHLLLQIRKTNESEWTIEGHVTQEEGGRLKTGNEWTIVCVDNKEPIPGRPAIWGSPFSGTPIRFDDLRIESIVTEP